MTNICENVLCTYNRPMPRNYAQGRYVDIIEDRELVRVQRYLCRAGSRKVFLCEVCHEAVRMIVTPNHDGPLKTPPDLADQNPA